MDALQKSSKEELIRKIAELENILDKLKEEKDNQELIDFPWIGNLGTWQWYFETNRVFFNPRKVEALGYSPEEIPDPIGFQFFTEKVHPDDYEMLMDNMRAHLEGKTEIYEFEYRIQTKEGDWVWFYDRGKVVERTAAGKPIMLTGIVFDITAQKKLQEKVMQQNEQLEIFARTDKLTKLNNRRFILEKLDYELRRAKRYQHPLCLLLLDIDHFKQINDAHGHAIGDKVLIMVANALEKNVRNTDIVGRYGGEEFLVILPVCSQKEGMIVAEKLRNAVMNIECDECDQITISGGLAEYQDQTSDELIKNADKSLYTAKESGRNRIAVEKPHD
jgi:diguanylate cyclase